MPDLPIHTDPATHPGAAPFALGPVDAPRVLLFHGLTGAPSELWPLGVGLAALGYRVEAPRWPGHGTTPEDLFDVSAADVLAAARGALDGPPPRAIVGLSMGGLLAYAVAPDELRTLVLLAPALRLHGPSGWFETAASIPGAASIRRLVKKGRTAHTAVPDPLERKGVSDFARVAGNAALAAPVTTGFDGRYTRIPVRWGHELAVVRRVALARDVPTRTRISLAHGLLDLTADPDASVAFAGRLGRVVDSVHLFGRSPHVLTLGPERGNVVAWVAERLGAV